MTKAESTSVLLNPSSFVDTDVTDLTAGEVILRYQGQEAKRRRNDDDYSQSDVPVPFRNAPDGLLEALDEVSSTIGIRKSIVTKCLSHHAMAWFQSMPRVAVLSQLYKTVHTQSDGYPDIIRRVKRDDYEFLHPRPVIKSVDSLRTVAFILGYYGDLSDVLGIPAYKMFLAGLCWSLSTNVEGWATNTVAKFLLPESQNIKRYLGERLLSLDYADKLVRFRQGDEKMTEYVDGLGKKNWVK